MFDVSGMHVLAVDREPDAVVLQVETDATRGGCPACGVVAVGHGRRRRWVADAPCFGVPVRLQWSARVWRFAEAICAMGTFTETHDLVAPRAKLHRRAITWATDALVCDDTAVAALARQLGVDWHTLRDAVEVEGSARVADPARLAGVKTLRVDWGPRVRGAHLASEPGRVRGPGGDRDGRPHS